MRTSGPPSPCERQRTENPTRRCVWPTSPALNILGRGFVINGNIIVTRTELWRTLWSRRHRICESITAVWRRQRIQVAQPMTLPRTTPAKVDVHPELLLMLRMAASRALVAEAANHAQPEAGRPPAPERALIAPGLKQAPVNTLKHPELGQAMRVAVAPLLYESCYLLALRGNRPPDVAVETQWGQSSGEQDPSVVEGKAAPTRNRRMQQQCMSDFRITVPTRFRPDTCGCGRGVGGFANSKLHTIRLAAHLLFGEPEYELPADENATDSHKILKNEETCFAKKCKKTW